MNGVLDPELSVIIQIVCARSNHLIYRFNDVHAKGLKLELSNETQHNDLNRALAHCYYSVVDSLLLIDNNDDDKILCNFFVVMPVEIIGLSR